MLLSVARPSALIGEFCLFFESTYCTATKEAEVASMPDRFQSTHDCFRKVIGDTTPYSPGLMVPDAGDTADRSVPVSASP